MICSRMTRPTPAEGIVSSISFTATLFDLHPLRYPIFRLLPREFWASFPRGVLIYLSCRIPRLYNNETEDLWAFAPPISLNSLISSAGLPSNQPHEFTPILQPNTLLGFVDFSVFAPQTLIPQTFKYCRRHLDLAIRRTICSSNKILTQEF